MKLTKRIIILLILGIFIFSAGPSYAYWIWSPKTGKWISPRYVVKPSPGEQLKFAKAFLEKKDYPRALIEFQSLIKHYPKAFEAAEAQFNIGVCLENMNKPYEAYLAYQKMIDKYPFSDKINEAMEKEFQIADQFISGKRRKFAGIPLPVENPALEILRKIIDNSTYGPLAPLAQYKLGLLFKALTRFQESQEEFEKVIANYPESEWAEPAKFQIATALAKISPSGKYDEGPSLEAKKRFEEFVRTHPDAELSQEALKEIDRIKERQAENNFHIARFYEKQKAHESARIYYNSVIDNHPHTTWAAKAMERVKIVEKLLEIQKKKQPLTKEEKETLRQTKKQEKQDRIQELKEKKETLRKTKIETAQDKKAQKQAQGQAKKEALQAKKAQKQTERQVKSEKQENKKVQKQAEQQAKLETLKKKQAEKQAQHQARLEEIKNKKAQPKIEKQTKLKATKNAKAEKQALRQQKIEAEKAEKTQKLQEKEKIKLEKQLGKEKTKAQKQVKHQAKLEAAKNKKTKKQILPQESQSQNVSESVASQEPIVQESLGQDSFPEPLKETPQSEEKQNETLTQKQASNQNQNMPEIETRPQTSQGEEQW